MTLGGTTPHWTWLIVLVPLAIVGVAFAVAIWWVTHRG